MAGKKELVLDAMSVRELEELQGRVEGAISTVKSKRIVEVKTEIEDILAKEGFSFEEIFGGRRKIPNSPPKYRNPDNPEQSWSGKGKRPNWLVEKINAGADKEDFRI